MDLKVVMQNEKNMGKNPLQQYKKEDFLALDKEIFTKKSTPETLDELRNEAVDMYSQESSYSICLHYIAGRIKLEARPHEFNMDLNNTLLNFYDARNWEVVKHLGTLIISKGANSIAYRILGDVAHEDGDDELMWRYYEKYVKSDNNDKDIILRLAEHCHREDRDEDRRPGKSAHPKRHIHAGCRDDHQPDQPDGKTSCRQRIVSSFHCRCIVSHMAIGIYMPFPRAMAPRCRNFHRRLYFSSLLA